MSDENLIPDEIIASAEESKPKKPRASKEVYSKVHGAPFSILGTDIDRGFKLEASHKSNKLFMKKLEHAVKIGYLRKG